MHKIGLVPRNQNSYNLENVNNENHQKNIQINSNSAESQQQQMGYIVYSQPNTARKNSFGNLKSHNANTSMNQQQLGASYVGLNNQNQQTIINNSLNMSSMIRNGNINQTRQAVNQFILPVPLKNETLKAQSSLPQLHNNMNISNSLNNPLNLNQSSINYAQNNKLQNSEVINRSYQQQGRIRGSKLNQSVSLASLGVGSTKNLGKRSFYHHSNIFNLKHYKNLTSHIIDGTDIDEIKNNQKSILIREFRYKVDQYLLFSKYRQEQAAKEFNSYYAKVQDQLFSSDGQQSHRLFQNGVGSNGNNGGISFFTMNYDDQNQSLSIIQPELNKSLLNIDANRFNYSKLSKEEASLIHNINVDIYLEDQLGKQKHAPHKINHVKLQDYILQKMKSYLSNDTEYDKKIEFVTKEYERILEKIQTRSFKVKIPFNYEPQMQSFNEYYKVDPSKLKQSQIQLTWQDIEANVMNQVLEESKLTDQIEVDNQDDNEQIEESYEEIEIEEQKIDDEDGSYQDQDNINNLKNRDIGSAMRTKRQQSQSKQQQKQIQQSVSAFQERPQVTQVKVVKKKKKKTDKQDTNPDENQDEKQNSQSSRSPQNRKKKKNDQDKEKSAIEEYIVYRELVPQQRPPKQNKPQTTQQQVQPVKKQPPVKKVVQPMVGTPKPKVQQIIPPPPTIQNQSPSSRQQQSTESPRQVNQTVKSSQNSDSEEDVLIFEEEEVPPQQANQQEIQKQQTVDIDQNEYEEQKDDEEEEEFVEEEEEEDQQIDQNLEDNNKQNDVEALDMTNSPKPARSKQVTQQQQLKKQLSKKPSSQSPRAFNQPSPKEKTPSYSNKALRQQASKQVEQVDQVDSQSENNDENDILEDEEYEKKLIQQQQIPINIQEPKSETPRKKITKPSKQKPQQQDQTPRSVNVNESPAQTPQNQTNIQETEFSYFNDLRIKKKVGTGLIDELVKTNYLLDFNPLSFKKSRRLPDLPLDLEFKNEEDKQLFDAIFKWQYEVDLEINELEETLQKTQKKRGDDESEDDEDDEDGPHEKSSVHSSDITDFGQPDQDKNSLQNISSGGISDID
ncbi:hypothetical protein TTHERM_00392910 (macronuclear) [Tetrahymena thermophila SB210]|uniref:Uncharacterized protein n=1 Tax=Tetrahymena thermophila (strain SB210) TaxID=312017 RepID=Q233F8_TETTS|nr:hypothetical protein TTHERM_00392910 [Tetrahymena thermophila SB210]EAR91622.1 hypothetical protein TTHERM_00392910 [Tetrahymena thermophila SB210]|eukprot:XP_001011867.1 hypothetical protein TTHERM_00392910 [Tetrahymena thermophila SB210]